MLMSEAIVRRKLK